MSGTSPTHFSPFHLMPARVGSQGLPSLSAEARLYMTRRLAGQEKPQLWNMPRPLGSAFDAAGRVVARLGEGARVEPVAAGGRAVVLELAEAIDLLAGCLQDLRLVLGVGDVGEGLAVDLLQDLGQIRVRRVRVGPGQVRRSPRGTRRPPWRRAPSRRARGAPGSPGPAWLGPADRGPSTSTAPSAPSS